MAKAYKDVCPCKDCGRRKISCHNICGDYKRWKKSGVEIDKKPFFEIKKIRRKLKK